MKKTYSFLVIAILAFLLFPITSFAATVPVKINSNVITASSEPTGCTDVGTPDKDGVVQVESDKAHQPLIRISYQDSPGTGEFDSGSPFYFRYFSCPVPVFNKIIEDAKELGSIDKILLWLANAILGIVDLVSELLIDFFGDLVVSMIKQGTFIGHAVVKTGWPFVQGFANLGFIFVLLYIALATTLRLEPVTVSVQRLLPKLLIGAILINFSLVIGGVLIDASRLIMATEMRLMSGGKLNDPVKLKDKLLAQSKIIDTQIITWASGTGSWAKQNGFWASMIRLIQGSTFRVLLAAAFGVVAVNLFVRYIALITLLIFSPVPYLAFILPKTQDIANKWWSMFLKWVFYGPVVLFFLVIITQIQDIDVASGTSSGASTLETAWFKQFVQFVIVIALFFVANKVGKQFAGVGSDAVMSFAAKNKRAAAAVGLGVATGGLTTPLLGLAGLAAGRYAGRGAVNQVRDFTGDLTSGIAKNARKGKLGPIAKFVAGVERDKDGKRTKDAEDSKGSEWAGKITGYSPTLNKRVIAERAGRGAGAPTFTAAELTNASLVARLDDATITAIARNTAQPEQFRAVVAAISKDTDGKIPKTKTDLIVNNAVTMGRTSPGTHIGLVQGIASNAKLVGKLENTTIDAIMSIPDNKTTENLLKSLATEKKKD